MFLFHHSSLSLPQSHFKSLPVSPVKTGLRSLRHFLATCHATRLTLTLFRSTPENHAAIYMHKSPGMVSGGIPPMWIFCLWMVGCRSSEGWWKAECATKTTVFRWSGLCLVMAWTSWWIWSTYTCQSIVKDVIISLSRTWDKELNKTWAPDWKRTYNLPNILRANLVPRVLSLETRLPSRVLSTELRRDSRNVRPCTRFIFDTRSAD